MCRFNKKIPIQATSSKFRFLKQSSVLVAAVAAISSTVWQQATVSPSLFVSAFHTATSTRSNLKRYSLNEGRMMMTSSSVSGEIKNVIAIDNNKEEDNDVSISSMTSKDFLVSYPSGAYTTARTCCGGTRIFEWEAHIHRTASSVTAMLDNDDEHENELIRSTLTDPIVLRKRLDGVVQNAIREHRRVNDRKYNDDELKITALVGWKAGDIMIGCHVTKLPPLPLKPVCVEIRGSPRQNAAAKDSSWVTDRAPLESLMQSANVPMNELLLTNDENEILEGSQTNFYAIIDGKVYTADEGILAGTVRTLLLDVCQKHGIPVVYQPPTLNDKEDESYCKNWDGALISSTSRLALPIDAIYIPEEGKPSHHPTNLCKEFNNNDEDLSLAKRIQSLVAMEVEARSTPIL